MIATSSLLIDANHSSLDLMPSSERLENYGRETELAHLIRRRWRYDTVPPFYGGWLGDRDGEMEIVDVVFAHW